MGKWMKPDELSEQLAAWHADAFGWALHCCRGDCARAEDVLQCACVKWLEGRLRPGDPASLKAWWLGVIRLTACEEWRRQMAREAGTLRFRRQRLLGAIEPVDESPHPGERAEMDDESARLRALLARLPARQAEALHLVFYQELSVAEEAVVMGISVGAARQHYDRGKRRLRELLLAERIRHE